MKKKKEKQPKPKYGILSCIGYMLRKIWLINKVLLLTRLLSIPIQIFIALWNTSMASILIGTLETPGTFTTIFITIVLLFGSRLILDIANSYVINKNNNSEHFIMLQLIFDQYEKIYDMDAYLHLEPEIQKLKDRAESAVDSNRSSGVKFPAYFSELIINVLNFVIFGTIVSTLNPWLLLLITAGTIVNLLMSKWETNADHKDRDIRNLLWRKESYFENISGNFNYGKDIRLNNLASFINYLSKKIISGLYIELKKVYRRYKINSIVNLSLVLIRDGITYGFLIYETVNGSISAAEFTLYFSAVAELSTLLINIINQWSNFHKGALAVSDYREFFEIKDKLNRSEGIKFDPSTPPTIEFRNVTFKYPESEDNKDNPSRNIIENMSFKINSGEKIALVGLNGAGKTTLAKLMCGLLIPTEGEVLINGHSIYEYNRDDLYSIFGLVPQQSAFLPLSIAENIALTKPSEIDMTKLEECIKLADLSEKIDLLPDKAFTKLDKKVYKDAIELSGGEKQKLLLARALYRNALMLILDEPTAALDPIAEDNMYQKYKNFTKNCTSLFISHRLSSTRFCDRILLLDGAHFAEEGSHDELIKLGGKYKELFDVQSQYYKEEVKEDE